ncbi:unnamed protein product, partial [Phaeothamnion confervicola]
IGTLGASGDSIASDWIPKIEAVTKDARVEGLCRDTWTGNQTVIPVISMNPQALPIFFPRLQGSVPDDLKIGQVLLGRGASKAEFPQGPQETLRHGQTDYKVAGTVRGTGFQDYFAFTPIAPEQIKNGYQEVWIQIPDKSSILGTRRRVQDLAIPGVTILTRDEYLSRCGDYVHYARVLQFSISAIGVLISITAAMNTMLMSTYERLREFAILRAIGASRATVAMMVTGESILLCLAGGVLGLLFGILASGILDKTVVVLLQLPFPLARVTPALTLEALGLSVFIGAVGALLPAIIVARLKLI